MVQFSFDYTVIIVLKDVADSPDSGCVDVLLGPRMEEVEAVLGGRVGGTPSRQVHRHTQVYAKASADVVKKSAVLYSFIVQFIVDTQTELFYLLDFHRLDHNLTRVFVALLFFLFRIDEIKLN